MVVRNADIFHLSIEIDSCDPIECARIVGEVSDNLRAHGFKMPLYSADSRGMVKLQKWTMHGNGSLRLYPVDSDNDIGLARIQSMQRETKTAQRVNDKLARLAIECEPSALKRFFLWLFS